VNRLQSHFVLETASVWFNARLDTYYRPTSFRRRSDTLRRSRKNVFPHNLRLVDQLRENDYWQISCSRNTGAREGGQGYVPSEGRNKKCSETSELASISISFAWKYRIILCWKCSSTVGHFRLVKAGWWPCQSCHDVMSFHVRLYL